MERLVYKDGTSNIRSSNLNHRAYITDIFTCILDVSWWYVWALFLASFFLSWFGFALIWWGILHLHGDLEPDNLRDEDWRPCIDNIHDFTTVFLFSMETQHTIGFGHRSTTGACFEAVLLQCIQSIVGVIVQAALVGVTFIKLSRPLKRAENIIFSKFALLSQVDDSLCLVIRIADRAKHFLINTKIKGFFIQKSITSNGTETKIAPDKMDFFSNNEDDTLFFLWPQELVHRIDAKSLIHSVLCGNIGKEAFEIIVIVEGIVEASGAVVHARTSYTGDDILRGYQFVDMVEYSVEKKCYVCNFDNFNEVKPINSLN